MKVLLFVAKKEAVGKWSEVGMLIELKHLLYNLIRFLRIIVQINPKTHTQLPLIKKIYIYYYRKDMSHTAVLK